MKFRNLFLFLLVADLRFALEKGKSSRDFKFIFENKSFTGRDKRKKEIERYTIESQYKYQLNKKNDLSIVIPYSHATLKTPGAVEDTLAGVKDVGVTHTMVTREARKGLYGVKWMFKLGLPLGKEQLSAGEDRVFQAMNETGQGFDKAPLGTGFNMGFDVEFSNLIGGNRKLDWIMGYTLQGNYSTLADQVSRKEPGDNMRLGFKNTLKRGKNRQYQWGITGNFTDKTNSYRQQAGAAIVSRLPNKMEYTFMGRAEMNLTPRLKKTFHFEYQQKDYFESLSSDGKYIITDQGDRIKFDWLYERKRNDRQTERFGIQTLFGEPNFNKSASGPAPLPNLGKDYDSRIEDIQLVYGHMNTINKYRKWYWNGSLGLTDDSRDYVVEAGLQFQF